MCSVTGDLGTVISVIKKPSAVVLSAETARNLY